MRQGSLFPIEHDFTRAKFDGVTIDPVLDQKRLAGQMKRVFEAMRGGEWFTLSELQAVAGGSEAGVSARIRDLRKKSFGGYTIDRMRCGESGLFKYRMQ